MTDGDPGDARGTAHRLLKFAESGLADFAAHVAPGLRLPGSYAGHEIGDDTRADLLYVTGLLIEAGVSQVDGVDLRSRTASLLNEVVGAEVEGFYSYRIAETVLRLGTMMLPADRAQNVLAAARSPGSLLTRFSRPRSAGGISLSWARDVCGRWPNSKAVSPLNCGRYCAESRTCSRLR